MRLVVVELCLGDLDRLVEILIRQFRVDDLVAVLRQEGRLDAAWDGLPAVEEEDFQGVTGSQLQGDLLVECLERERPDLRPGHQQPVHNRLGTVMHDHPQRRSWWWSCRRGRTWR